MLTVRERFIYIMTPEIPFRLTLAQLRGGDVIFQELHAERHQMRHHMVYWQTRRFVTRRIDYAVKRRFYRFLSSTARRTKSPHDGGMHAVRMNSKISASACIVAKTSCAGGRHNMPRPCKLTFDLLNLRVMSESHVTWATSVLILVFLRLSVLDLGPMNATDRQTSDAHHRLMSPSPRAGT